MKVKKATLKHKYPFMPPNIYARMLVVDKHLKKPPSVRITQLGLTINDQVMLSANKCLFKTKIAVEWVRFKSKDLADAMNDDTVEKYYEKLLKAKRKDMVGVGFHKNLRKRNDEAYDRRKANVNPDEEIIYKSFDDWKTEGFSVKKGERCT